MFRTRTVVGLALTMVLSIGSIALAGAVTPTRVLGGPGRQYYPSVNDSYLVYTQWSPGTQKYHAYAREIATGDVTRLNASGTNGSAGNFDPGTNRVLYEQADGRRWGLYFYDLDTGARTKPGRINSPNFETLPLASSTFITYLDYASSGPARARLRIYDRSSRVTRTIDTWNVGGASDVVLVNDSLGERYATYTVCSRICSVWLYDSVQRTRRKIHTVNGRHQYSSVVDELNSLVFYVRSGADCGASVAYWQLPLTSLSSAPTRVVDFADGIDVGGRSSLFLNPITNQMDLYFGRVDCPRTQSIDVWVASGVAPGI